MATNLSESQKLIHVAEHVFLPPKLPQSAASDEDARQIDHKLVRLVIDTVNQYAQQAIHSDEGWSHMSSMLSCVARTLHSPLSKRQLQQDLTSMKVGDVVALHIHQQNAAVLVRKAATATVFEIFEVQAPNASVMSIPGKLVRAYPGPAIQVPSTTANDAGFIEEVANFLARMDHDVLEGSTAKTKKAGSKVAEERDSADPHYISQLFTGILRGMGTEIAPRRVVKRIADEVLWDNTFLPWRRSPTWLIVRVALQTSIASIKEYKHFMVFFHARLLEICATEPSFSSDLLFAMRAKMARRLLKVQDSVPEFITEIAKKAGDLTQVTLQGRWTKTQSKAPLADLVSEPGRAVVQSLPHSREYLAKVLQGRSNHGKGAPFVPNHRPRLIGAPDFAVYANGALTRAFEADKHIALFDFESAVREYLPGWTSNSLEEASGCSVIASCIDQYTTAASTCYAHDAADRSIMILTVMELWVALDKMVTTQYPLLEDYSPEIPQDLIEPLLLRTRKHIEGANAVQCHIRERHASSTFGSVFVDKNGSSSLPVRYFRQSSSLQKLKQTIETQAQDTRKQKIRELSDKNQEHTRLTQRAALMSCSYHEDDWGISHHNSYCEKCRLTNEAGNMRIEVDEWPLPSGRLDAEALVFELQCPDPLNIWRTITYKILCELAGSTRGARTQPHCILSSYDGLSHWAKSSGRITIASSTKSFIRSHYSFTKIPSTESAVCVNNGLSFRLFDLNGYTWATAPFTGASFEKYGTFALPNQSPYQYLQYALAGTTHTSNQVLSDQSDCPKDMSLHEHYAFGTLRSGSRLQWMNIVRGLEENTLTFNREEVYALHTQAAWQIGHLSDGDIRDWHSELSDIQFGRLLAAQALRVLNRVKGSWLEATTVRTIIMLVSRFLASTTDNATFWDAYEVLREARSITFHWLGELSQKLEGAELETQILDYQHRVCEMAAICRSTYDVDLAHLLKVLTTEEDYSILISCSVILYDNQPPTVDSAPSSLQVLLSRDRRLAHKAMPLVNHILESVPRLLDRPVSEYWDGYRPAVSGWSPLPKPNMRWVTTMTANTTGATSQEVHLNLLEGRLLIDGKPLGRLPREYVAHPTYSRLFGQKVLNVVPADSSGMVFATRAYIQGNKISFALDSNTAELIVQSEKNKDTVELIPHAKLAGDFPFFFSSDYHHWIDLRTGVVEFRPLAAPWSADDNIWRLNFSSTSPSTMRRTSGRSAACLVDFHCHTFQSIARQLAPLESSQYLHITHSESNPLEILAELPRMKLSFFVNEDAQLESTNLRNQVMDEDQSAGTIFGLLNQLVLRAKSPIAQTLPQSRTVLVPYGRVDFSTQNNHTRVTIDSGTGRHVTFYQYKIDEDLRYLAGNADLTGRLYKIYLHALTSHCLPDPLTGRTGTEEALHELSEAATTSFEQINEEQARLLQLIGALTPKREYYPAHLQSMQTTHWSKLPFLAQHYAFGVAANSVLERARVLALFSPLGFKLEQYVTEHNEILLERALHRTKPLYPDDITVQLSSVPGKDGVDRENHKHEGRDHRASGWLGEGQAAAWASHLSYSRWGLPTYVPCNLVSLIESWDRVEGSSSSLRLTYSPDWLTLDLPSSWISLYQLCRQASRSSDRYKLCYSLASAIYASRLPRDLVPVLIAFATNPSFQHLAPPKHASYQLSNGYEPSRTRVLDHIRSHARGLKSTPSATIARRQNETEKAWSKRRQADYDSNVSSHMMELTQSWLSQWPNLPSAPSIGHSSWFNIDACSCDVCAYYKSCTRNVELRTHLRAVEEALVSQPASAGLEFWQMASALRYTCPDGFPRARHLHVLRLSLLMKDRSCLDSLGVVLESSISVPNQQGSPIDTSRLAKLLAEFSSDSGHRLRQRYGVGLESSRTDLAKVNAVKLPNRLPSLKRLSGNRSRCRGLLREKLEGVEEALGPLSTTEDVVYVSGIWPRLTPRIILGRIALWARKSTPIEWQGEIMDYARIFIEYQRSQRLISLAQEQKLEEFYKELDSGGGGNENESNLADWLLVQIDGNFGARRVQSQVAREMISPSSAANTVLQLNMGEGKSSVIVPIIAAALADNSRLVRVVVLKPLWRQMFHLLVSRLAGLVNRRVYYLPFGRHIRIGSTQANQIQNLYTECMREGGILLVQPEHILSFKLMGIDQLVSASTAQDTTVAHQLRDMQGWLSQNTRDILDESDEILHVRYQLVYTVGEQQPLEDHPDRWTTTQQLLVLVTKHIEQLKREYPEKLVYETRPGGQFPFLRIMPDSDEVVEKLIHLLAKDVLNGLVSNLNFGLLPRSTRDAILPILTEKSLPLNEFEKLADVGDSLRKGLLLLRGLLACGIVAFTLKDKHYRVDYGLHLSRSLLAVPYHAKDIPSLRAEFGHPDVAIVLTCLSYYNEGLTDTQLDTCFELLYKLDNPALEYEQWAGCNSEIPHEIRQLSGINIKDREQFANSLVPAFSKNSATVSFFLNAVVFPKEAKDFPHKLSTSGWDLAEVKSHVTTGFSGTNDNRYLLPTSIAQSDPVKQSSTNALVLTYLLQPENNRYVCTRGAGGETCSAKEFVKLLVKQEPEIRVLLDVGAQMLELQNEELVRYWLSLRRDIAGALYFNDKDELMILPQDGSPMSFHSSPLSQQLDKCIVYLDDGHTRGTDLKLPRETRAAVTLGPKVTKDRLLQGCMRMRKLGFGQSVMFCAPAEIDSQIRRAANVGSEDQVDALDVLRWAMLETCNELQHYISHWAQQGVEYNRRLNAQRRFASTNDIHALKLGWTSPESRPLEDMYGVSSSAISASGNFTRVAFSIPSLAERLNYLGVRQLVDSSMDEEQEREVSHEIERERQIERPPKATPATHNLHADVRHFVRTGTIPTKSKAIFSLFRPLSSFQLGNHGVWSPQLLGTLDYHTTLAASSTTQLSDYMRPLNWILSGPDGTLVALSPFEVQSLLPEIRQSSIVRLHVYAPRVTQAMISFSDLCYYTMSMPVFVPPRPPSLLLQLQINLFAGQLYLESFGEYRTMCAFLGIYSGGDIKADGEEIRIRSDGFIMAEDRQRLGEHHTEYHDCNFTTSPVMALRDLIGRRRKGMGYFRTNLGQILHARQLTPNDFQAQVKEM